LKNQPKIVYLQHGCNECEDFTELSTGDITWSADNIHGSDLEYISKDWLLSLLAAKIEQIDLELKDWIPLGTVQSGQKQHRLRGQKKEFKQLIKDINEKV